MVEFLLLIGGYVIYVNNVKEIKDLVDVRRTLAIKSLTTIIEARKLKRN